MRRIPIGVQAYLWAAAGGGLSSITELLEADKYDGPLDLQHLMMLFVQGALAGLLGYVMKQKALYTPVPDSAPPSEERENRG